MASTAKLVFESYVDLFDDIIVKVDVGGGVRRTFTMTFVEQRSKSGQVTIGEYTGSGSDKYVQAENYSIAWNLDYKDAGGTDNLKATFSGPEVTLTIANSTWQFYSIEGQAVTDGEVSSTITNGTVEEPMSMDVTGYSQNADPCNYADATIELKGGTGTYNLYIDSVAFSGNPVTSPATVPLPRGKYVYITGQDTDGNRLPRKSVRAPRKVLAEDISLTIENFDSGATVTITETYPFVDGKPLTYSIGNAFQSENVFTGLPAGNYTLQIKDALGCVTTKAFVIDGETEVAETVFMISDINPFRFAKYEPQAKKNHRNTLSCHELKQIARPYVHKWTENDIISTQLKTNAQYLKAFTMDDQGNTHELTLSQKTTNIGLKAKSTSTYFDLGGGRSGIYFGVVDLLDYDTEALIETTDYGFTLPEWANEKGQKVTIEGIGQVTVDEIGYSDFYDSFILIFNITYTGTPVTKKISAIYNLQPFEVYEFDTYMNAEPEMFNVIVEAGSSAENIEFTHVSEKVKRVVDSDKLFEVQYWDSKNKGGMVYKTGIKHKLRLEGFIDYRGEQKTEGYNGDSQYYTTDNEIFHSEQFVFTNLSTEMAHKLRLVVAHDHLVINNIEYKLAEAPEISEGFSYNMRTFSVSLKSGGELFLDSDHEIISGSEAENEILSSAIEASKGKSLLLWTKING